MKRRKVGAEAPSPTHQEVCDLAYALALDEEGCGFGRPVVEMFYAPPSAPPPEDMYLRFLHKVTTYRRRAKKYLRLHYAYYHELSLRRQRWLRTHPTPRDWAWTRQPLKNTHPPPRRRVFRPPGVLLPDAEAPPLRVVPGDSPKRSSQREQERLLCYNWLFDNRIVFLENTPGGRGVS